MTFKDLTGKVWGRLTLISAMRRRVGTRQRVFWKCQCSCGTTKYIRAGSLRKTGTISCGCAQKERLASLYGNKLNWKHGGCAANITNVRRLYQVWQEMKSRCLNPKHKKWSYYGGRGISISERWMKFERFRDDMLPSYVCGLTVERINNAAGYSKANCKWATRKEQANNRRPKRALDKSRI